MTREGPTLVQSSGERQSSHLLTEAEAAAFVKVFNDRKSPVRQFRDWAIRWGVPVKRVGRKRLYDRKVLEAFLDGAGWTKRHRAPVLRGFGQGRKRA